MAKSLADYIAAVTNNKTTTLPEQPKYTTSNILRINTP